MNLGLQPGKRCSMTLLKSTSSAKTKTRSFRHWEIHQQKWTQMERGEHYHIQQDLKGALICESTQNGSWSTLTRQKFLKVIKLSPIKKWKTIPLHRFSLPILHYGSFWPRLLLSICVCCEVQKTRRNGLIDIRSLGLYLLLAQPVPFQFCGSNTCSCRFSSYLEL